MARPHSQPGSTSPSSRDIRLAPASGDVVSGHGCGSKRGLAGGCGCRKDLGPMEDHEEPSQDDIERFSGVTRTCSNCRKEVYDEAEVCYHCGEMLVSEAKGPPVWVIIGAVLAATGLVIVMVF